MFAHLSTAVVILDQDLKTADLNPAAESLFSVSRRTVLNKPIGEWLPGAADFREFLERTLLAAEPWTARAQQVARSGGLEPVTVDVTVTSVEGGQVLLEFTGLDRHLRIHRENQLHAQQLASRELVLGLAHEVKNPLGGIRGAAQLLDRRLDDSALKRFTQVIISETDRLGGLVDTMLVPDRPLRREALNIHEVTEHVVALVEAEFPSHAEVICDYDPSLPEISGDRDQLVQALLNLVRNAMQACSASQPITIATRIERQMTLGGTRHRQAVAVDVIDSGPGIPDAMQARIFLPLVTTRPEGSGLGLAIAQSLVTGHGGLIECASRPGHTVFTMWVPL